MYTTNKTQRQRLLITDVVGSNSNSCEHAAWKKAKEKINNIIQASLVAVINLLPRHLKLG